MNRFLNIPTMFPRLPIGREHLEHGGCGRLWTKGKGAFAPSASQ